MDVFRLRRRLVDDYGSYVSSFIRIKDERVEEEVRNSLGEGLLWPDPLIQLNPSFEAGETVDELVAEGTLHEGCARVFRKGKKPKEPHNPGEDLRLHRHHAEAIRAVSYLRVRRQGRRTTAEQAGRTIATKAESSGSSYTYGDRLRYSAQNVLVVLVALGAATVTKEGRTYVYAIR